MKKLAQVPHKGRESTRTEILKPVSHSMMKEEGKHSHLLCFSIPHPSDQALYYLFTQQRCACFIQSIWNFRLHIYKNPLFRAEISFSIGPVNHQYLHNAMLPEKHPQGTIFPASRKQSQGDLCKSLMLSNQARRAVTAARDPLDVHWL